MLKKIASMASSRYPFGADDFVQQVIGSAILTAPFIFTEEVWRLGSNTNLFQSTVMGVITLSLGYGVLYIASQKRDWDEERKFLFLPIRYVSLMAVTFGTVGLLIMLTGAHQTFEASIPATLKVISMISMFSVIGAATADNLI